MALESEPGAPAQPSRSGAPGHHHTSSIAVLDNVLHGTDDLDASPLNLRCALSGRARVATAVPHIIASICRRMRNFLPRPMWLQACGSFVSYMDGILEHEPLATSACPHTKKRPDGSVKHSVMLCPRCCVFGHMLGTLRHEIAAALQVCLRAATESRASLRTFALAAPQQSLQACLNHAETFRLVRVQLWSMPSCARVPPPLTSTAVRDGTHACTLPMHARKRRACRLEAAHGPHGLWWLQGEAWPAEVVPLAALRARWGDLYGFCGLMTTQCLTDQPVAFRQMMCGMRDRTCRGLLEVSPPSPPVQRLLCETRVKSGSTGLLCVTKTKSEWPIAPPGRRTTTPTPSVHACCVCS